jgi:hypothetical protein
MSENGGVNYARVFVRYVFATQEGRTVTEFARTVDAHRSEEELLREGELNCGCFETRSF